MDNRESAPARTMNNISKLEQYNTIADKEILHISNRILVQNRELYEKLAN